MVPTPETEAESFTISFATPFIPLPHYATPKDIAHILTYFPKLETQIDTRYHARKHFQEDPAGYFQKDQWIPASHEQCIVCKRKIAQGITNPFALLDHCRSKIHLQYSFYQTHFSTILHVYPKKIQPFLHKVANVDSLSEHDRSALEFMFPTINLPTNDYSILL